MTNTKTGGPAFPSGMIDPSTPEDAVLPIHVGMTLLDYFAAHAPITLDDAVQFLDTYGGEVTGPWPPQEVLRTLADLRVEYAKAIMKARKE